MKTIRSVATTPRRRGPKPVSTGGSVSLLATEQDTLGGRGPSCVRNLLIPISTHPGSSSLPLQSSAGNGYVDTWISTQAQPGVCCSVLWLVGWKNYDIVAG